jgi:RNA polymerase sigma factor (sigma-70 family)
VSSQNHRLVEQLIGLEHADLRAYATKRVGQQDADDILQDAYLHLLQREESATIREPRSFLFRIIANLSIDAWRKSKHQHLDGVETEANDWEALACPMPGPEDITDGMMRFDRFLNVLDELPELQRHAFILNKIEGMSHVQIAEQLGVCTKSVCRYLIQAMTHIADRQDSGEL